MKRIWITGKTWMRIQSTINADFEFSTKSQHLLSSISAFHVPLDGGRQTLTVSGCKQLIQRLGQHIHHKRMWWLAFPVEFFLCLLRRGGGKKSVILHTFGCSFLPTAEEIKGHRKSDSINIAAACSHTKCDLEKTNQWMCFLLFLHYTVLFCF